MTGPARRRGRHAFALACLLLAAGFTALGIWQVERRAWKLGLIAKVDARIHAAAAPLPPRRAWGLDQAYVRVRVAGTFRHDRETLVQALTERGAGWWVLTPLVTERTTLLVNRGFVDEAHAAPATRAAGRIAGRVTVTGLLRTTEPGGGFLRRNDPAAGRWYSRDVAAIAAARGIGDTPPFFLDADAGSSPGGWPVGGLTVIAFRNTHLLYALTWFGLAAMALGGAVLLVRGRED